MSTQVSASFRTAETSPGDLTGLGRHVRWGLNRPGQKLLGPEYLYDEVGSALFEAITYLPEYGLTRADERLLSRHADQIAARAGSPAIVVEMGSGSGRKMARLLSAIRGRHVALRYFAVDVSESALTRCQQELSAICPVTPVRARFLEGLSQTLAERAGSQAALVLLVGSTIGNFDRAEANVFLSAVRGELRPGDHLLIGVDLVKNEKSLLLAYDDPAGVTAAFNKNLLGRINRELGANFDLRLWKHVVRYDRAERRVEMHLESLERQSVLIPGAECTVLFRVGETIWTESSYKYTPECLDGMARSAGFSPLERWIDAEWPLAECLWKVS